MLRVYTVSGGRIGIVVLLFIIGLSVGVSVMVADEGYAFMTKAKGYY